MNSAVTTKTGLRHKPGRTFNADWMESFSMRPMDWDEPVDFKFDGLLNIHMSMVVTFPDYLNRQANQTSNKKT